MRRIAISAYDKPMMKVSVSYSFGGNDDFNMPPDKVEAFIANETRMGNSIVSITPIKPRYITIT